LPNMTDAHALILTREEGGLAATSGVSDVTDFMKETGSLVMRDGKWQSDTSFSRKFHFLSVDKTLTCYPMEMDEMKHLNIPSLKNVGSYIAELGLFADTVMLGLQLSLKHAPIFSNWLAKLLSYATSKIKAPFGAAIQVIASDSTTGQSVTLSLFHERVYELTTLSMMCVVEQLVENRGNGSGGVFYGGLFADPWKFISSCEKKGVKMDLVSQGVDVKLN